MAEAAPILLTIPERLVGMRVVLRPWRAEDADGLWEAIDTSREHLAPWMPWLEGTRERADVLEFIIRSRARWLLREDLTVAIVARDSGRILGGSGLHRINWTLRTFEIGYWIRQDAEGHGYVTETVELLTRLAFDRLAAVRVEIRMDTRNLRSRRVPERLGFTLEGTLRRALAAPDGTPQDVHVFGMVREERTRS